MNKKYLFRLAAASLIMAAAVFLLDSIFPVVRDAFYNIDFALKKTSAPEAVAVVGIDGKSISDIGVWPWPREKTAELIDSIGSAGAKVIVLDMIFPGRDDSSGTRALRESLERADNICGGFRAGSLFKGKEKKEVVIPLEVRTHRFGAKKNSDKAEYGMIYSAQSISFGDNRFTSEYARAGLLNVSTDISDQNLRNIVHVIRAGEDYYPSAAIAAASEYLRVPQEKVILDFSGRIFIDDKRIDVNPVTGSVPINYYGESGSVNTVSASDILRGKKKDELKDRLVFVGLTDAASGSSDMFTTPVGSQFPGVEIWATASANIIEDDMLSKNGLVSIMNLVFLFLIFPGLAILLFYKGRKPVFILLAVFVLAALSLNPFLFIKCGIFWNPAGHMVSVFFMLGWMVIYASDLKIVIADSLRLEPDEAETKSLPPPSESAAAGAVPACETSEHAVRYLKKYYHEEEVKEKFSQLAKGRIIRILGSGGMADVYLVWNPELEVYRAVKVIKPGQIKQNRERFETEVKISANLNHTNIVSCYDTGVWNGLSYIEMEYVRSVSFDRVLGKVGNLTSEETAGVGILVCRALHYAHRCTVSVFNRQYDGVVHRDIKPSNILFCRSGKIKIADFGIARPGASVSIETETGKTVAGTLPYLSPEQLESEADPKSDIYSLGTVMYEMVSGKKAFPQQNIRDLVQAKKAGVFEPLSESVYGEMAHIINRAMMLRQDERYDNAGEMSEEIVKYLHENTRGKKEFLFQGLLERILSR